MNRTTIIFAVLAVAALIYQFTSDSGDGSHTSGARSNSLAQENGGARADSEEERDCRDGAAIYRSVFTDAVKGDSPQTPVVVLGPTDSSVTFFTEVFGAGSRPITHRWIHNETEVKGVSYDSASNPSLSWSSKVLEGLAPGDLRVEVRVGDCVMGRQSIQIASAAQLDPAGRTGWMRPAQALETALARKDRGELGAKEAIRRIDRRDDSGDTWLTAAIRRRDTAEAVKLIKAHNMRDLADAHLLSQREYDDYRLMADPFLRDRDGISPIDLAHRTGQTDIVEMLLESAIGPSKPKPRTRRSRNEGTWSDSLIHTVGGSSGADERFANGDTALLRAVRLGNERAVLTLLQLGTKSVIQPRKVSEQLYAFDASGRQSLDIARSEGFYGVERLLQLALSIYDPPWVLNRATFAASMDGDEPGECRKVGFEDESELYFFAELADMQGRKISHVWRYDGEAIHTETVQLASKLQRTRSSRRFSPEDVGPWDVDVVTESGDVLGSRRLFYKALTPEIDKNRDRYIGIEGCNLGGNAMYALVDAQASISKIQYLLDRGATLEPRSSRHKDLFYKAIQSGNIPLTRWFIDRGADIDASVKDGRMPLAIAAEESDVLMVRFLLNNGANVDRKRFRGKLTALQIATVELNVDLARLLLERGADPNLTDDGGATALHRATGRCSTELSRALLEYGADPTIATSRGVTPRDYAAKCLEKETWHPTTEGLEPLLAKPQRREIDQQLAQGAK